MRSTYSFKLICSSPDLQGCVTRDFSNLGCVYVILMDLRLQSLAKLFVEFLVVIVLLSNFSKLFQALLLKVLLGHKEDLVLLQTVSREMFRGRSSESTTPLTKFNHSGMGSSQSTMVKKMRRRYNLMLLRFFLVSNKSKGARHDTKNNARNSSWPSTLECFTDKCPIVRQRPVERCVLFVCHILRLPHPERFVLVALPPHVGHLFRLLRLSFSSLLSPFLRRLTRSSAHHPLCLPRLSFPLRLRRNQ